MPKPTLIPEEEYLISDIISTLIAGHQEWRPDLEYPESSSDMKAAAMALLVMFEVKRRPVAKPLSIPCPKCGGIGAMIAPKSTATFRESVTCDHCKGNRKIPYVV